MQERFGTIVLQLADPEVNRRFTRSQMPQVSEVIETGAHRRLVRTGDEGGFYLLFNQVSELVDAVVRYQARSFHWLSATVTQCMLWRRPPSLLDGGSPVPDIGEVLVSRHRALMSEQQDGTEHGLWRAMIGGVTSQSRRAGIANLDTGRAGWHDGEPANFDAWLREQAFDHGCRYLIAERELA